MSTELATLQRSADDVKVAGVCSALARRYDVDPTLVRVAMLMLALCGGIGFVLYAAGWALLPRQGESVSPLRRVAPTFPRLSRGAWIAAVVVACLAVASIGEQLLPFGLVAGAIIVWIGRWWARRVDSPRAPAAVTSGARSGTWPLLPALADSALAAPSAAPARRPRRTLWITLGTIAAMLVAVSVSAPLLAGHLSEGKTAVAILAVMVIVLGVGVLAGSFHGKPWLLAIVTAVMTVSLGITALAVSVDANPAMLGDVSARPTSIAQLSDERTSMGNLDIDYSAIAVTDTTTTHLATSAGNITLVLPATGNVVVNWQTSFGSYTGPDRKVDGPKQSGSYTRLVTPGAPVLTIDVSSKMGDIKVRQS